MSATKIRSISIAKPIWVLFTLGLIPAALAQGEAVSKISSSDTAFLLLCTAMVFLMTPGLAFFYGGLMRKKNVLSVLMQCYVIICLVTLQWVRKQNDL